MNKLSELTPGKSISTIVRVLENQRKTRFKDKEIIKARVGDGTNIANLVAWGKETRRWNLNKDDIVKITNGICPETHRDANQPPTITISSKTTMEKQEMDFPSIQECMKRRFLDQVFDYSYSVIHGFIVQVYDTASYFCKKCKKFSDEMCDCGNFPEPIFRIRGIFSDGTRTMRFATVSEDVAESLSGMKKSNAKKIDVKMLMNKPYTLLAYCRDEKLYVEEVIE
ncbi:MAG: hypothetical protein DRO76_04080 [Candidatus Altiarchaeales archaeon]|nr:MAG: hypothetical protein DRO76_04080 [Candidatus Altiarchaeales archaeon]HDI72635.1 hypothetical protein [Candidatus Altiarchaeales archaeon]